MFVGILAQRPLNTSYTECTVIAYARPTYHYTAKYNSLDLYLTWGGWRSRERDNEEVGEGKRKGRNGRTTRRSNLSTGRKRQNAIDVFFNLPANAIDKTYTAKDVDFGRRKSYILTPSTRPPSMHGVTLRTSTRGRIKSQREGEMQATAAAAVDAVDAERGCCSETFCSRCTPRSRERVV